MPLGVPIVIRGSVGQLHQMPDTPRNDIAAALYVPVLLLGRTDDGSDGSGH